MISRFSFFLLLLFLSFKINAQKNRDPFARSARLPDVSVGVGYNQNAEIRYKVPGGSLVFNAMYFDFNRRFLVGLDFTKNINNRSSTLFTPARDQDVRTVGRFSRNIYNQTIFSVRGGWMFNEKLFVVAGTGLERITQFKEYNARDDQAEMLVFHTETEEKFTLFYTKFGVMYRFNKLIAELFYSQRGIGVGLNYFFGD